MRPLTPAPRTAFLGLLCLVVAACDLAAGSASGTPSPPPGAGSPSPSVLIASAAAPTVEPSLASPTAIATSLPSPVAASPSIAAAASGPVLDEDLPFDAATSRALQKVLDAARKRIPTPGISVAIRTADGHVWLGTSGARQLSPRRPVTDDTVFSIASITKTFVTAVVLQLVDEGKLSLDDRLSEFMPDFPDAKAITIRQLLQHRSGVFNYFESARYGRQAFQDPNREWTTREILRFVESPYCQPGTCFHYSNTNFVLLGEVVRQVTGRRVSEEIRDRLLDPLGLDHTSYQPDERTPANGAHGHTGQIPFYDQSADDRWLPNLSAASIAGAAGAMVSNAADLARWVMALYGSDLILPKELRDEMMDFRPKDKYGLGTRTRIFSGRRGFGHGGSLRGYSNEVWYFPREGVSIAVLTNVNRINPDKTVRQLLRELWKHIDVPASQYDPSRNTSG